jgi:hypothetical protein
MTMTRRLAKLFEMKRFAITMRISTTTATPVRPARFGARAA